MRRWVTGVQLGLVVCSVVGASSVPSLTADRTLRPASQVTVAVVRAARPRAQAPAPPRGTLRSVVRWNAAGIRRELVEVAPVSSYRPLPLVVVLHGRRQTPWRAERIEGWDALAANGRAVVAYGAGYAGSWDAGRCCGPAAARRLDDDAYLLHVLRVEEQRHRIDRRRVYLVGFSNGGMLTYQFACAHSSAISAFAVVAGSLETSSCRPSRGLAVLDVQGEDDRVVPYGGSRFSRVAGAPTASVPSSLRSWRAADGSTGQVQLVRLPRLGHEWPTRRLGWDATAWIWHFLSTHSAGTSR